MAVKKVSSEVAFITEPRTDFTRAAKSWERNVTLGSWPASSIVLARKWVEADTATIEVELPTDVAFSILPQRSDSSVRERARYVSIPTPVGQRRIFLIDQIDLQELSADRVKASIKALSPEAWLSQVPSTVAGADQAFSGSTAEAFKTMLYESTVNGYNDQYPCTESIQGVQYRALPILGPGSAEIWDASQLNYYGIQDVNFDPKISPSDGKPSATVGDIKPPFPAPVGDKVFSLMKSFPYQISMQDGVEGVEYRSEFEACLVPIESPFKDGCLWWRWLFHKREAEPIWISRQAGTADGEATLHLTTGKTDAIAWIASSVEGSAGKAATASFPGKPRYTGPWASVEAKEVSEGQHLGKADAAREAAAALAGLQAVVTIDATANAGSDAIDGIKLRPGTIAGVRFGKQAFTFPINEVDYSFSVDNGWEIKAPVTVETNSIDYRYPWRENPVPPEQTKAGLKRLYGAGWRGSIAQDLRGEWWVLGSTGTGNTVGEPVAKKIEELPAEAELIALTTEDAVTGNHMNSHAIFQAGSQALVVSTGLRRDGDKTTITPVVRELALDGPIVSVVETPFYERFTLVSELGTVYDIRVSADGEATVSELTENSPAGIFKPISFKAGAKDGRLLVASSRYVALMSGEKAELTAALEPGEAALANPLDKIVITSHRVLGLENQAAAEALEAHGGVTGGWHDFDGCFIACSDGALLFIDGNRSWNSVELVVAPVDGATWRGVLSSSVASYRLAWGSRGLMKLERSGGSWNSTTLEAAPVLTADGTPSQALVGAQVCFTTETGELKTVGNSVSTVSGLSFKPKRCWASLPLATQEGNVAVVLKGQILVAGEGSEAALLTQSTLSGPWKEEKLSISSPVAEVVKPLYGSFFIRLEDGSLVDEQGKDILAGSVAEGAKVFSIAEDSETGCCWLATDRGAFRAAATHDSIFVKPPATQPSVGQVEKLEGSWGELKLVSSGVMAGPEEAHFGHPASAVRLAELTSPAVAAEPSGDSGCFLLLEDGSVCLQPSAYSGFWRVAEAPDGWKPAKLKALSSTEVLAWTEDGHSEKIEVAFTEFAAGQLVQSSTVTGFPQLAGGLTKLKAWNGDAFALSGGKLFSLAGSEWREDDRGAGESEITDFAPGWPFCFQRGDEWLLKEDDRLQKISGLSGELLSRDHDLLSTAGGAVDMATNKKLWSEADSRWVSQPLEPAVVSTEAIILLWRDRGAVKLAGGFFRLKKTEIESPADHSQPWWPVSYSLEAVDSSVEASTVSKRGSLFWLGSDGLTDGDYVLSLSSEQRDSVDWTMLADVACFSELALTDQGLLVPLKSGELAWLKHGEPLARFISMSTAGLLGIFGKETIRDALPALAASSSAVSAAWPGEQLSESSLLITAEPRGLRGEELTPVVWGRYGLAPWEEGRWKATWPALAGLGAITEARAPRSYWLWPIAACERGAVAGESKSWPGDGIHFEPSGYRLPATGQLALLRTGAGELWVFCSGSNRAMAKLGKQGVVADQSSTAGEPITVAGEQGLTMLTVEADGSFSSSAVEGSLTATTAYKKLGGDAVVAYDAASGALQALVEANVAEPTLLKAAEPTETGLTAIRGEGTNNAQNWVSGPLLYGADGVVAVSLTDGALKAESWSEKLAKLGLPTEDSGDDGELPIP